MNVLYTIAIVLMVCAAFGVSPKGINLWFLGWAFVIAVFAFGSFVIRS